MSDEYTSSDDMSNEIKGKLLMASVSILAATTLVIACWAGLT